MDADLLLRQKAGLPAHKDTWPESGAWVELEPKVRIEVDPQTGEALAFEIEEFRLGFLARRPYLDPADLKVGP